MYSLVNCKVRRVGETFTAFCANIRFHIVMLFHVDPQTSPVTKSFITSITFVRFASRVNVFVLFEQFLVIESFPTSLAHKLIISCVLALVVTQSLRRGKTVTTLVADVALLSVMKTFMDVLQMSRRK